MKCDCCQRKRPVLFFGVMFVCQKCHAMLLDRKLRVERELENKGATNETKR